MTLLFCGIANKPSADADRDAPSRIRAYETTQHCAFVGMPRLALRVGAH
jgi:hypothetical protein